MRRGTWLSWIGASLALVAACGADGPPVAAVGGADEVAEPAPAPGHVAAPSVGGGIAPAPSGTGTLPAPASAGQAGAVGAGCPAPTADIQQLVDHLDDDGDPLHGDITPSVLALIRHGVAGACAVSGALLAADNDTRLHASRVFEGVIGELHGFRGGRGFPDQYAEEALRASVAAVGYDANAPLADRTAAAARWRTELQRPLADETSDGPSRADMLAALQGIEPQLVHCGEPVDVTVTFVSAGTVESIYGTAATSLAYRKCLHDAAAVIKLRPFTRKSVWTRFRW